MGSVIVIRNRKEMFASPNVLCLSISDPLLSRSPKVKRKMRRSGRERERGSDVKSPQKMNPEDMVFRRKLLTSQDSIFLTS